MVESPSAAGATTPPLLYPVLSCIMLLACAYYAGRDCLPICFSPLMVFCLSPFFFFVVVDHHFYFPAQLVGGFTLSDLMDKPWSQVSSLLPPDCG